jgi:hypothetical protein
MVAKQQTTNRLTAAAVQDFASRLRGELIQPSDPTYDSAQGVQRHDRQTSRADRTLHRCG